MRNMNVIRSREHELFTEEINKVGSRACDNRRIILENAIDTLSTENRHVKTGRHVVKPTKP